MMIKVSRGCCGQEELDQVKEAFDYGYFGLAYKVNEFEQEIQKFIQTDREVICTCNGTAALHLALDAIGVSEGDEVILPSFTFVATAQAISSCGANPVFVDVDEETMLIDIEDVRRKITDRTKAIVPVHYSGAVCDMEALLKIKEEYGIRIIEDAAHAFGSVYKGKKVGSFGDIACFSFDSIKVMTCGEGGCIITNDKDAAELIRIKRLLGIDRKTMHTTDWKKRSWKYDVPVTGYRYHMSNINAAIGLAQIKKLNGFIDYRKKVAKSYNSLLSDIPEIKLPVYDIDTITNFMYVIRVKNGKREELKQYLMDHDIESGISYIPCHTFSLYKGNNHLPATEKIYEELLCLPIHPEITESDLKEVSDRIHEFFRK
ncbi:MAG: DegT/DnrJ/EryC1/StrS family aminotransferase [Erysipelotrichaceae bacterium]|nr:DegT/DnrJ/EryC1/StrS family aminotransferase [Erysipelotrichaceae bacterium]